MKRINVFFLLGAMIILSGCGPRMQQVKNYIPPVTDFGKQCLETADIERNACEEDNRLKLANCDIEAQQEAGVILDQREKEYTVALENYIDAQKGYELLMLDYEEQQRLIRADGELAYVRCSNDVSMTRMAEFPECRQLFNEANKRASKLPEPAEPIRPRRPTYDRIYAGLKRQCNSVTTNCGALYDEAYIACGGQIEYQSICVANCD